MSGSIEIKPVDAPADSDHLSPSYRTALVELYLADCFDWMRSRRENSIHGIVTDPPYGLIEYEESNLRKLACGRGGVWRIPPIWHH